MAPGLPQGSSQPVWASLALCGQIPPPAKQPCDPNPGRKKTLSPPSFPAAVQSLKPCVLGELSQDLPRAPGSWRPVSPAVPLRAPPGLRWLYSSQNHPRRRGRRFRPLLVAACPSSPTVTTVKYTDSGLSPSKNGCAEWLMILCPISQ